MIWKKKEINVFHDKNVPGYVILTSVNHLYELEEPCWRSRSYLDTNLRF